MADNKTLPTNALRIYKDGDLMLRSSLTNNEVIIFPGKRKIIEEDNRPKRPYAPKKPAIDPVVEQNTCSEPVSPPAKRDKKGFNAFLIGYGLWLLLFAIIIAVGYWLLVPSESQTTAKPVDVFQQEIDRLTDNGYRILHTYMAQANQVGDIAIEPHHKSWYLIADKAITMDVYNNDILVKSYKLTPNILWDLGKYEITRDDNISLHFTAKENNTRIVYLARYSW